MNWRTAFFILAASVVSALAGWFWATHRPGQPPGMEAARIPVDTPWVQEIVTRVKQLEDENAELKSAVGTAEDRMAKIETVFVSSGLELKTATEQMEEFRASLAKTDTRLSRVDEGLSSTKEKVDQFETDKKKEEQQLKLEDFVTIDPDPINGVAGPHIFISGANVHIESGSGATDDFGQLTGLGNLFIGYNEPDNAGASQRFGSHNLVVGAGHGYASYGGFLAGYGNATTAPGASVSGGTGNIAAGTASIVCGGNGNTVTGDHASVTGGSNNEASGAFASIIGGSANSGSGDYASITGGASNDAVGNYTNLTGGENNRAEHARAAIIGGIGRYGTENQVLIGSSFSAPQ